MKVCFVVPNAYGLFEPTSPTRYGGIETRSFTYACALAKQPELDISFVVRDEGQVQKTWTHGLTLYSYNTQRPPHRSPVIEQIDADLYISFGINYMSSQIIAQAKKLNKRTLLCIASDSELIPELNNGKQYISSEGDNGKTLRYSIEFADKIIVQNTFQQKKLKTHFKRDSQLFLNPINTEKYSKSNNADYILWIGRADHEPKRPHLLIKLAQAAPEVHFKMILNPKIPSVSEEIKTSLPKNVTLIESVPFSEVPKLFSKALGYVSTSSYEGFPNTFLQAGSSQVPILSLDVNPEEILTELECGYFACGDLNKLAEQIILLNQSPKIMNKNTVAMNKYILDNHSLTSQIKKLIQFLSSWETPKSLQESLNYDFSGNVYVHFVEAYVREMVNNILSNNHKVGIYPAGKHTKWMKSFISEEHRNNVVYLDDNPTKSILSEEVFELKNYDLNSLDKIIFSIDTDNPDFTQKAKDLFNKKLCLLYEDFPPGPYILK
ncbi:MAG: glycosyltransferase [Lentisphaeraceae bacterium]|nr:glycosyltransferase [Lentisphaeraceae bacterium]